MHQVIAGHHHVHSATVVVVVVVAVVGGCGGMVPMTWAPLTSLQFIILLHAHQFWVQRCFCDKRLRVTPVNHKYSKTLTANQNSSKNQHSTPTLMLLRVTLIQNIDGKSTSINHQHQQNNTVAPPSATPGSHINPSPSNQLPPPARPRHVGSAASGRARGNARRNTPWRPACPPGSRRTPPDTREVVHNG